MSKAFRATKMLKPPSSGCVVGIIETVSIGRSRVQLLPQSKHRKALASVLWRVKTAGEQNACSYDFPPCIARRAVPPTVFLMALRGIR